MNRTRLVLLLSLFAACGDGAICPAGTTVAITSPGANTTFAVTQGASDFTLTITASSTLAEGQNAELSVLDENDVVVATASAEADVQGLLVFSDVLIPLTSDELTVTLAIEADGGDCGLGNTSIQITLSANAQDCALDLAANPITGTYYDPIPVLNALNDQDTNAAGLQTTANFDNTGASVSIRALDVNTGSEVEVLNATADGTPKQLTIPEGQQILRAVCTKGGNIISSNPTTYFIDSVAPSCTISAPSAQYVVSTDDLDGNPGNGTQFVAQATSSDTDVDGQSTAFTINGMSMLGSNFSSGVAEAEVTVMADGDFTLAFNSNDRAENPCEVETILEHVTSGCQIALTSPISVVNTDSNNDDSDGVQGEVTVAVDVACAGQVVTTDCGEGTASAVANGAGVATIPVTWCNNAQCEFTENCTSSVESPKGFPTETTTNVSVDTLPPTAILQVNTTNVSCGSTITDSIDADGDPSNGVQIDVTVVSPAAVSRSVDVSDANGTINYPSGVGGQTRITITSGTNDIVGNATDAAGNTGTTAICNVSLADIAINFAPNIADGVASSEDGTVNGSFLSFDLCGTVDPSGGTVEISIDGGAAQAATVNGASWCLTTSLAEGNHLIDVSAQNGMSVGIASLALEIDITGPSAVTGLTANLVDRHTVSASWQTPADTASFEVRYATQPLTDQNFSTAGTAVSPPAPGGAVSVQITGLFAGADYYVGVVAIDAFGNPSPVSSFGPTVPDFLVTGEYTAPDPADGINAFGFDVVSGLFNDDAFYDVAVGAPFKGGSGTGTGAVYVYFGSASGLASTPSLTFTAPETDGQFGRGLAAVQWSTPGRHDLVISSPYAAGLNGRVDIYNGGAAFDTTADINISVSAQSTYFSSGTVGWSLSTADHDGDGTDDLIAGAASADGGNGAALVIYGGTVSGSFALRETGNLGGAVVEVLEDPQLDTFDIFTDQIHNLGRTTGSGDAYDDLGIAYTNQDTTQFANQKRYIIFRGNGRPVGAGMHFSQFDSATDLNLAYIAIDTNTRFGQSATLLPDVNGNGTPDIAIGAPADGANTGRLWIFDGGSTGVTDVNTIEITDMSSGTYTHLAGAIGENREGFDVNQDGIYDLIALAYNANGEAEALVWFGGSIPTGNTTPDTADHIIPLPPTWAPAFYGSEGTFQRAKWLNDINGDSLPDMCISQYTANSADGGFVILWDDAP